MAAAQAGIQKYAVRARRIEEHFKNGPDVSKTNLLVLGPVGSGKSALVRTFQETFRLADNEMFAISSTPLDPLEEQHRTKTRYIVYRGAKDCSIQFVDAPGLEWGPKGNIFGLQGRDGKLVWNLILEGNARSDGTKYEPTTGRWLDWAPPFRANDNPKHAIHAVVVVIDSAELLVAAENPITGDKFYVPSEPIKEFWEAVRGFLTNRKVIFAITKADVAFSTLKPDVKLETVDQLQTIVEPTVKQSLYALIGPKFPEKDYKYALVKCLPDNIEQGMAGIQTDYMARDTICRLLELLIRRVDAPVVASFAGENVLEWGEFFGNLRLFG